MPALRFSKSDATIATLSSPANSLSAEVDLPGISSASSKFLWSSVWQKYWERKSSGRQTIPAPFLAASRMKSRAREKFFSGSAPQRICTSAAFILSCVMSTEVETALNVSETVGDSSTSLGMTRRRASAPNRPGRSRSFRSSRVWSACSFHPCYCGSPGCRQFFRARHPL